MELTLEKLKDGEKGVVERLTLTGPTKRRLIERGITPGTEVRVLKRAPLGDPIEIYLRRYTLTLRAEDQTLTDDHAEETMQSVLKALKETFNATIR